MTYLSLTFFMLRYGIYSYWKSDFAYQYPQIAKLTTSVFDILYYVQKVWIISIRMSYFLILYCFLYSRGVQPFIFLNCRLIFL